MTRNKRHVEISDGERVVTSADVTTSPDTEGTARAFLHAEAGHIPPGSRADLVDAVLDLPEVQDSDHLQASVPLGDSESLHKLQERCAEVTTRPAGSTALVDAQVPGQGSVTEQEPRAGTAKR
jgi:hypothetical protein